MTGLKINTVLSDEQWFLRRQGETSAQRRRRLKLSETERDAVNAQRREDRTNLSDAKRNAINQRDNETRKARLAGLSDAEKETQRVEKKAVRLGLAEKRLEKDPNDPRAQWLVVLGKVGKKMRLKSLEIFFSFWISPNQFSRKYGSTPTDNTRPSKLQIREPTFSRSDPPRR
jgi:hypothetical protein